MAGEFVIAHNPEPDSKLPYLVRLPLGGGVVLKARETWPRTSKVYCHRADGWPDDPEIVERVPVRSCTRRGPAVDLVLDRARENRSQFVFTVLRTGREAIFWQSARTTRKARPRTRQATGRAGDETLALVIDSHEHYPYRFAAKAGRGHVDLSRRALPAGDYGVEVDGTLVAAVERKGLEDLATSLTTGKLGFALAELAALPRAAVVVEERYSKLLALEHVRPSAVADALAEVQVRWPSVPIAFCETRPLAEEWTYRFLAAASAEYRSRAETEGLEATLPPARHVPPAEPTPAQIREWARRNGWTISDRGRVPASVIEAYRQELTSGPPGARIRSR
ncbi:MAG: hypothetical protein GEU83_01040 [Pseudonocardiaceae bacterium]|nr:hypothetical protein [Pseudonocardiaceae bacterium]